MIMKLKYHPYGWKTSLLVIVLNCDCNYNHTLTSLKNVLHVDSILAIFMLRKITSRKLSCFFSKIILMFDHVHWCRLNGNTWSQSKSSTSMCMPAVMLYDAVQPMKQKTYKQKALFQSVQGLFTCCHSKKPVCVCWQDSGHVVRSSEWWRLKLWV